MWWSGCGNVPRSSIRGLEWSFLEDSAKNSVFFAFEGSKLQRQLLSRWLGRSNVNKKDKSKRSSLSLNSSLNPFIVSIRCFWWFVCCLFVVFSLTISHLSKLIYVLLLRGGIESNPGPEGELTGFQLISQNCRGLTDKKKLSKIL